MRIEVRVSQSRALGPLPAVFASPDGRGVALGHGAREAMVPLRRSAIRPAPPSSARGAPAGRRWGRAGARAFAARTRAGGSGTPSRPCPTSSPPIISSGLCLAAFLGLLDVQVQQLLGRALGRLAEAVATPRRLH